MEFCASTYPNRKKTHGRPGFPSGLPGGAALGRKVGALGFLKAFLGVPPWGAKGRDDIPSPRPPAHDKMLEILWESLKNEVG